MESLWATISHSCAIGLHCDRRPRMAKRSLTSIIHPISLPCHKLYASSTRRAIMRLGFQSPLEQYHQHAPASSPCSTYRSVSPLASSPYRRFPGIVKRSRFKALGVGHKVASAKGADDDDAICQLIVERLKGQVDVACADVARTAWTTGQSVLATKVKLLNLW